jgi:hypothetical protein
MKPRTLYALSSFAIVLGSSLALASPAQAFPGQTFVTVCGDSASWYVNPDENGSDPKQGDRRPLPVSDGLVFSPSDLIHHMVDMSVADLKPGSFVANPTPSPEFSFSVEVVSASAAYGTLHWDGSKWSITIGAGTGSETPPVTPGTFSDANPVTLLDKKVTKWGPFDPTTNRVKSFGVGYTNSPAGTVASLVSSISFMGTAYKLSCPIAPIVVTKTIVKTVTVTPDFGLSDLSPSPSHASSDQPAVSTQDPSPSSSPTDMVAASNTSTLVGYGIATVGIVGVTLVILGVAGIARRRRAPGKHSVNNSETTVMPAIHGDDDYDMTDYGPSAPYDPSLGGYAGESRRLDQGDDTKPMPPVE